MAGGIMQLLSYGYQDSYLIPNINISTHTDNRNRNIKILNKLMKKQTTTQDIIYIKNHITDLFNLACEICDLNTVKWIYGLPNNIDNFNDPFIISCENGRFNIAKWLYNLSSKLNQGSMKINIRENNDKAFRISCSNNHTSIAKWLCTLEGNYMIINKNGKTIPYIWDITDTYKLLDDDNLAEEISKKIFGIKSNDDVCMICLSNESKYWISLDCGHDVCSSCFKYIDKCPIRCNHIINAKNIKILLNSNYL